MDFLSIVILVITIGLIVLLCKIIAHLWKVVALEAVYLHLPFKDKKGVFIIEKQAKYSVWHRGLPHKITPFGNYSLEIFNLDDKKIVATSTDLIRASGRDTAGYISKELYGFSAIPGRYELRIAEKPKFYLPEVLISDKTIANLEAAGVDMQYYSLEIKDTYPTLSFIFLVLSMVAVAIIFVFGLTIAFTGWDNFF